MKNFKDRLEPIQVEEPVTIPTLDGSGIAETISVKVPAWRDPKDGEIYLDTEATAILDKVKARRMGLLSPEQIKTLRERLCLTQKQISELLQIGEKTWTRWETGRDRPSRSINVLLFALNDGKIDIAYLRSLIRRRNSWGAYLTGTAIVQHNPWLESIQQLWQHWRPTDSSEDTVKNYSVSCIYISQNAQSDFGFASEIKDVPFPMQAGQFIRVDPVKSTEAHKRSVKPACQASARITNLDSLAA